MKLMWPYPFPAWAKCAIKQLSATGRQCAFLLLRGYKVTEVSSILGVSHYAIYNYRRAFLNHCRKALGKKRMAQIVKQSQKPREWSLRELIEHSDPYQSRPLTV